MVKKQKAPNESRRGTDDDIQFRLGFATAYARYLLGTLKRLPVEGVPDVWLKWKSEATKILERSIFYAEQAVHAPSERARAAAKGPRKETTRQVTKEWLHDFRQKYIQKTGKTQGWKKAARFEANVSAEKITEVARLLNSSEDD